MVFSTKLPVYRAMLLLFLAFAMISQSAQARMYQWTNPETGHTQLSGKPPTWYRGTAGGPRVLVFENGQLIDDSAVNVSELHRTTLRNRAFQLASEEDKAAQERRDELKAAMQRSLARQEEQEQKQQDTEAEQSLLAELFARAITNKPKDVVETEQKAEAEIDTAEKLKSIIEAWDKEQARQARKVLKDNPL